MALATPFKSAQKVKPAPAAVHYQDSQDLVRFLALLGFESKKFLQKNLFLVPNKDAFQQIVYFLLGCLDQERRQIIFKDVWPIFDKKAEAEFRRLAFDWYKQIQANHSTLLPSITASLFHSPGGRKFLSFINSFTRFVARQTVEKNREIALILAFGSVPANVVKRLKVDNMERVRSDLESARESFLTGKKLGDKLSGDYRTFRSGLSDVKLKTNELVEDVKEVLEGRGDNCSSFAEIKEILDEEYEVIKKVASSDAETIDRFHKEVEDNSRTIYEVLQITDVPGINVKSRPTLDLSKFSTISSKSSTFSFEGKSMTVTEVLDKLFASATERCEVDSSTVEFPTKQISKTSEFVFKERDKFLKTGYELNEQLVTLKANIKHLEDLTVERYLQPNEHEAENLMPISKLAPISFEPQGTHPLCQYPFILSNFSLSPEDVNRKMQLLGLSSNSQVSFEETRTSDYYSYPSNLDLETRNSKKFTMTPESTPEISIRKVPESLTDLSGFSPCLGAGVSSETRTPLTEVNKLVHVTPAVFRDSRENPSEEFAFQTPALFRDRKLFGAKQTDVLNSSPLLVASSGEKENGDSTPTASVTKFFLSPSFYEDEAESSKLSLKEVSNLSKDLTEILVDEDIVFCGNLKFTTKTKRRTGMSERFRRCSLQGDGIIEEDLNLVENDDS